MAKKCPPGIYYCFDDKKCKKIPRGYHIGARGYLARGDNRSDSGNGNGNGSSNGNGNGGNGAGNGNGGSGGNGGGNGGGGMGESIIYEKSNPRIPRKAGQPAKSKKHSDLYTDEDPKGTIHGLGFKDVAKAKASVSKIRNSSRSHAHKIQAAVAMEQRAREMGKTSEAAVYRKFINMMKKKTKKMNEEVKRDEYGDPVGGPKISKKQKEKNLKANTPDEQHTTTTSEGYGSDRVGPALTMARAIDKVNPRPKPNSKRTRVSRALKLASIKKDEKIRKREENPYSADKRLKMVATSIRDRVKQKARAMTTREDYIFNGRITELISSHKLFNDLKINSISSDDRFMFCGSMGLNNDLKKIMIENNFNEGANNYPGEFVLEKAFVD